MSSKDSVAKYKQVKESDPESLYKDVTDQAGSSGRGLLNIPIPESVDKREVDQLQIEVQSLRGFRTCCGVTSQALCLRRRRVKVSICMHNSFASESAHSQSQCVTSAGAGSGGSTRRYGPAERH